jgi:DNA-binding transcriptional LysR family regulator
MNNRQAWYSIQEYKNEKIMPHLPTTTALRVITALSQHGSVSAAATALNLTQSAVSKQLKAVETLIGLTLYERGRHGLVPTEAGVIYTQQARVAIGALETAAARVAGLRHSRPVLRLHILPILGDRWFMPRLIGFSDAHPEIDVQFVTYYAQREVSDQVDVAFQFGTGHWPGWRSDYFFGRDVILVAAPRALERDGGFNSLADIARYRLLIHQQTPLHWEEFAAAHPGITLAPEQKSALSYYALVIRSAIAGQGLALVPRVLITDELASGELVNPLGLGFSGRNSYWMTTPEHRPREGATALFCAWALEEARKAEDPAFAAPQESPAAVSSAAPARR